MSRDLLLPGGEHRSPPPPSPPALDTGLCHPDLPELPDTQATQATLSTQTESGGTLPYWPYFTRAFGIPGVLYALAEDRAVAYATGRPQRPSSSSRCSLSPHDVRHRINPVTARTLSPYEPRHPHRINVRHPLNESENVQNACPPPPFIDPANRRVALLADSINRVAPIVSNPPPCSQYLCPSLRLVGASESGYRPSPMCHDIRYACAYGA